ncbi:MAG: hypothetical protein Q8L86_10080 [Vicinamibacterales bacterium]|nr:hypothetical protein [Vicinamibacterales bacterium]
MADLRKCRVTASVTGTAFEGSAQLVAGQMVDLDQSIGGGHTLRAYVHESWFEPVAVESARPVRRGGRLTPAELVTEEKTDGD